MYGNTNNYVEQSCAKIINRKGVLLILWVIKFADNPLLLFLMVFSLSFIHLFIPPIPLESGITLFSVYLAGTRHGNLAIVWLAMASGMSVGSNVLYWLVKLRSEYLLNKNFIKRQLSMENIAKARRWFQNYGVWTIYASKCIPGMNFLILFCCGFLRVSMRKVFPAVYLSNLMYYGILIFVAKSLSKKIFTLPWFKLAPWIALLIIITGVGIVVLFTRRNKIS